MTEEAKKEILTTLEAQWQEERRKIKRYRFLLKGAEERKVEIEKQIKNL